MDLTFGGRFDSPITHSPPPPGGYRQGLVAGGFTCSPVCLVRYIRVWYSHACLRDGRSTTAGPKAPLDEVLLEESVVVVGGGLTDILMMGVPEVHCGASQPPAPGRALLVGGAGGSRWA